MLEIRRRANVKKLTKGEWTFDCTIEVSGDELAWMSLGDRSGASQRLSELIADTCDVASAEIQRLIQGGEAPRSDASE